MIVGDFVEVLVNANNVRDIKVEKNDDDDFNEYQIIKFNVRNDSVFEEAYVNIMLWFKDNKFDYIMADFRCEDIKQPEENV
jgi:hypothetical protein